MTGAIAIAARVSGKREPLLLIPAGGAPAVRVDDRARVQLVLIGSEAPMTASTTLLNSEKGAAIDFGHALYRRWGASPRRARDLAGTIAALDTNGAGLMALGLQWTNRAVQMIEAGEYRYVVTVLDRAGAAPGALAVQSVSLWNDLTQLNLPAPASIGAHDGACRQARALADVARALMAQHEARGTVMRASEAVRIALKRQGAADAGMPAAGDRIVVCAARRDSAAGWPRPRY